MQMKGGHRSACLYPRPAVESWHSRTVPSSRSTWATLWTWNPGLQSESKMANDTNRVGFVFFFSWNMVSIFFPSFIRILAWILIIWKIVTFDHHGRREIQGNTVRVTVEKEIVHRAAKHGKRQKGEQASARIRVRLTSVQGNTGEPHTLRCSSFLWKSTVSFRISVRCHQDWVHSSDTLWATASLREGLHSGFPLLSGNGFVGVFT